MNKWLARLEALEVPRVEGSPDPCTRQNRQKAVLSVLAGEHPGGWQVDSAVNVDSEVVRRHARYARLIRWGWSAADADAMVDRLARRDAQADDRVTCAGDCAHYRPGNCANHRRAGLQMPDVGIDLASLLQRCPGHQPTR